MIINRYQIGAGARRRDVYAVCADATETGSEPKEIARFESLDIATAVMRYMRGDSLSEADEYRAKDAIKKVTAPAVESKDSH